MDTSGARHRGVLTGDDMARWTPRIEAPLTYDYRRYTVCKTGPWGQGPVMLQQLALLKGFDLDGLDPAGADFIHLQVECAKLAYADRDAFYGDPDFVEVPMATLSVRHLQCSAAQARDRHRLAWNCGRDRSKAMAPWSSCSVSANRPPRRQARENRPSAGSGPGNQPSAGSAARGATPCISTSSIKPATWYRRRRPAAGCNLLRSFPSLASASAPVRRCSGWTRDIRPRSRPGNGRGPRSRRRSPCVTASHISPGAHPAAMRRTNGSRSSSCAMFMPATTFSRRSTRRRGIPTISRLRSGRVRRGLACWWSKAACRGATVAELKRRGHIVEVGPDWSEGRLTAAAREGPRRRAAANARGMQGYAAGR